MSTEIQEPAAIPRPGYLDMENPLDGFDWDEFRHDLNRINDNLAQAASFLVMFSSELLGDLSDDNKELLKSLDDASHEEAAQSNALIKYFAGTADERGRALSWCLWTDRKAAANALHGQAHKQAIKLAKDGEFYETYDVRFYDVSLDPEQGFVFTPTQTNHNFEANREK